MLRFQSHLPWHLIISNQEFKVATYSRRSKRENQDVAWSSCGGGLTKNAMQPGQQPLPAPSRLSHPNMPKPGPVPTIPPLAVAEIFKERVPMSVAGGSALLLNNQEALRK